MTPLQSMQSQAGQQSPLDQLKDIHLPDPISIWPLGTGWWLLILFAILLIVFTVIWIKKNRWKRAAKRQLLSLSPMAEPNYYYQINRSLKQIAIQRFGHQCAHLSGLKWLDFLDSKLKHPLFNHEIPEFAAAPDNPDVRPDPHQVKRIALLWLKKHKTR